MLTFTQFILEAGDFAHEYSDKGYGDYSFKHGDSTYRVSIEKHKIDNQIHAKVEFSKHSMRGGIQHHDTNDTPKDAIKVLSTVHNIVKKHVSNNPDITHVNFGSDETEPSRVKLYTNYTKKHGGVSSSHATTPRNLRSTGDTKFTRHIIPVESYK